MSKTNDHQLAAVRLYFSSKTWTWLINDLTSDATDHLLDDLAAVVTKYRGWAAVRNNADEHQFDDVMKSE